jgi:K+-sensing histidine kinase KdpD
VDAATAAENTALRERVAELDEARERLGRLYATQLEENRKRAHKLQHILRVVSDINSDLDPDTLLSRIAETIQQILGFRIVLIRVREPGTNLLRARAFAGLEAGARAHLEAEDVNLDDFLSWLKDEFKVSHSYFISHKESFNQVLPAGHVAELGPREEWEWHSHDVLLVPLYNREGELTAYFSVDDPVDRMVPAQETVEMLEMFGHHAVVAIENARLYRQLEAHTRDLEDSSQRMKEVSALKSNFVATVSHELRTPLTAIRAYVDAMLGGPPESFDHEQISRFLRIISEETQRLARLIESVLDLNRFDSGHLRLRRQSVDMAEILAEALHVLEPVGQAGQVALKMASSATDTQVDPTATRCGSWCCTWAATRSSSRRPEGRRPSGWTGTPGSSRCRWRTPASGSPRRRWSGSSSGSTRWIRHSSVVTAAPGWGSRSASRSSTRTPGACSRPAGRGRVRASRSCCRGVPRRG